jgi:carboxypeptidase Q
MRKLRFRLAVLLASLLMAAAVVAVAPRPSAPAEDAQKILTAALGPSPLEANLRRLTDEVGSRLSTSVEMRRATAWAQDAFRAAGVDRVWTEEFEMPAAWAPGDARLEVIAPARFEASIVSIGWSPATPAAGLEARVVDAGSGSAEDFARIEARGALVLVHSGVLGNLHDLFIDYLRAPEIVERARAAGAAGILWMSTREHGLLYRYTNDFLGRILPLPQALVAREDAERIARLAAAGQAVRARLEMGNRTDGSRHEENVVAEIRGREWPDEVVILGAHLDSWDLGTGALDNGVNCTVVVDAARAILAAGLRPRRTLRFVLFSGEEQGLHGSRAYVRAHRGELDRTVAVVIFDLGTGRTRGYSLGGRAELEPALREILEPVADWGLPLMTADAFIGTDNFDFLLEGVPNLVAMQEEANYITNYHASSDTLDKVDVREAKLNTAIAALTLYGIAERSERLGARQSRAEIAALLERTGLVQQMQVFGLWPLWERGELGRAR